MHVEQCTGVKSVWAEYRGHEYVGSVQGSARQRTVGECKGVRRAEVSRGDNSWPVISPICMEVEMMHSSGILFSASPSLPSIPWWKGEDGWHRSE